MQNIQPNQTGDGPRREFASQAEWRELATKEVVEAIIGILARYNGSIDVTVNGDATADCEITFGEYVLHNRETNYFYHTINLPRWPK